MIRTILSGLKQLPPGKFPGGMKLKKLSIKMCVYIQKGFMLQNISLYDKNYSITIAFSIRLVRLKNSKKTSLLKLENSSRMPPNSLSDTAS